MMRPEILKPKKIREMDSREMMQAAPKGCEPTVVDTKSDYQEALERVAKANRKKVENLTPEEREQARRSIGLCDLDMQVP